jgi:hypothetical protein
VHAPTDAPDAIVNGAAALADGTTVADGTLTDATLADAVCVTFAVDTFCVEPVSFWGERHARAQLAARTHVLTLLIRHLPR